MIEKRYTILDYFQQKSKYIFPLLIGILVLTLFISVGELPSHRFDTNTVTTLSQFTLVMGEVSEVVELPIHLDNLAPNTPLSLTTTIDSTKGTTLYFKSIYSPFKVFLDETLIYAYGQDGTFPEFLIDPPTKVCFLSIDSTNPLAELRFEFFSPTQRDTFSFYPALLGTTSPLGKVLVAEMGTSVVLAAFLLVLGIMLIFVTIVCIRLTKSGIAFFWLALFTFSSSFWIIGESNLTALLWNQPYVLYVTAFCGMFYIAIPLIHLSIAALDFHNPKPLYRLSYFLQAVFIVILVLQLSGTVAFSKTMYIFHMLNPLCFLIVIFLIVKEAFHYQNKLARQFLIPISLLFIFGMLELVNYYILHLSVQNTHFFQIGVLLFILSSSLLCGSLVGTAFLTEAQKRQLESEISFLEKEISSQKKNHHLMEENTVLIKRQRHDLRHQLAVIRRYNDTGNVNELTAYLDELTANIPVNTDMIFCQNTAVNNIISYYYAMGQELGITDFEILLVIPDETGNISASDLCILIGNLLENAIEACKDTPYPYIHLHGKLLHDFLTFSMENSCIKTQKNGLGKFISTKRNGGIGLTSIQSVAQKYRGHANFQEKNGVFSSFVLVHFT